MEADIATALLTRCATLAVGTPNLPIAMPDVAFTPPTDGRYLEVAEFPNRPFWEGVSSGRIDQGLLQVTVVWPRQLGVIGSKTIADGVISHFAKGTTMSSGSAKVRVSREPWQSPPIIEDHQTRIPVTIPWMTSA